MAAFKNSIDKASMQDPKPEHGESIVKAKRRSEVKAWKNTDGTRTVALKLRVSLMAATLSVGLWLATPAWANTFFFSTGNPDGKLGALSRPAGSQGLETETADDFFLTQATVVKWGHHSRVDPWWNCCLRHFESRSGDLPHLPLRLRRCPRTKRAVATELAF